MSSSTTRKFNCPGCSQSSEVTIWESINVGLDPELKQKVLDGTLFSFECPVCGHKESLVYATLYHDQERRFMTWWMPSVDGKKPHESLEELNKNRIKLLNYRLRLVPSLNRLKEKILIFENDLDDRVIELLKLVVWSSKLEVMGILKDQIYFNGANTAPGYPEIEFVAFTQQWETKSFQVNGKEWYPRASEVLHQEFKVPEQENTEWRIVDHTYWNLVENGKG